MHRRCSGSAKYRRQDPMKDFKNSLVLTFGALLVSASSVPAIAIPVGNYSLHNHPAGSEASNNPGRY